MTTLDQINARGQGPLPGLIVLFTNNPILAVNTDPDNYLLMQLQSAKAKEIVSGFAIDAQEQKPLLLNIREGRLETFDKRANQYE